MASKVRDWGAAAERLKADVAAGGELVPVGRLRKITGASPGSAARWIVEGKRGVYLDAVRGGGRSWLTTEAAVWRFLKMLSGEETPHFAPGETPSLRSAAHARDLAALRRLGVPV